MEIRGGQLESGSVVGGYRIDSVISRGGMGVVYRATNVALHRVYALKTLAPELTDDVQFRERFKREMRIAASISHPNVVGIHYAGEHDGTLFLVMDFIYGTDLSQLLRESGGLEPERAVDLLAQFASALDAAHAKGLVHRDVKPANMLITVRDGEEHGYLTDFGIAKRSDSVASMTATGGVLGTVHYMAPEQVNGDRVDARTDVYALGCVFFQMLTGNVPYERENSIATLFAHVHDPPPPLPDELAELYPTFGGVIEQAMAKKPEDRYVSAGDFARDAACALTGSRYQGPGTVVAMGDARPRLAEDEPEPVDVPAREASQPSRRMTVPTPMPEAPSVHAGADGPARGRGHGLRWAALAAVLVVAVVVVAVIAITSGGTSPTPPKPGFAAALRPVPTNRVNATGNATIQVQGNVATVTVDTNGLLRAAHLMHIHGGTGNCPPASAAQNFNGHQFISASVGDKYYGPVVTSLTQIGDTGPASHLSSSLFTQVGNIRYKRTINLGPGVAQEIRNGLAVIVVHGIDYDGGSKYDNYLGPNVEATAPALCGPLFPAQSASAPRSGGAAPTTYVASLKLYGPTPGQQSVSSLFWCHPGGKAATAAAAAVSRARAPT
jgi:tRNA A-37 threonylcarbamoyl transferase component Bud32